MTGRTAVLVALALVVGCGKKNDKAPETKAGSAGPALEGSAKPQPSEAAPEGSKPPPVGSAESGSAGSAATSGEAAPAVTWEKYVSKEQGFSIELPGKAEERDQSGLKMVGAEFGVTKADQRTSMCGVAFVTLPNKADNPKQVLEASVARHKENATVIEDKEITLGKHPGRTLVVENTSHRKWMRVYLVDKTIYILNCGGPFDRAKTDGPIAEKALASFALAK